MAVREVLEAIAAEWPAYKVRRKVDSKQATFKRITEELPALLRRWVPVEWQESVHLQGKTGAGNITAAPWIATFDPKVTLTATEGFYVVYLYSVDLRRLYLSIAFGTTQFEKQFPRVSERHQRLEAAADTLRKLAPTPVSGINAGRINLGATRRQKLHNDYQAGSIFDVEYDVERLPDDARLQADYVAMLRLYKSLVGNPILPEIEELLEEQIEPPETPQKPIITDFVPRKPKVKGEGKGKAGRRISKESKKVGDQGESLVVAIEQDRLRAAGLSVEKVIWHAQKGEKPGWDISSCDDTGKAIYIEVKASVGKKVSELIITANEWSAARKHRGRYYIYLVTNVMGKVPLVERLRDPWDLVQTGQVGERVASVALNLALVAVHGYSETAGRAEDEDGDEAAIPA